MSRSWKILAISAFCSCLLLGGFFGDRLLAVTEETREGLRLYTDLLTAAHDNYAGDTSYKELVWASIQGLLRPLDPHTAFLTPEAYNSMREKQQSTYFGLGLLVGIRNNQLTVISPIEGSPAARLGMRAGDVISDIEGQPTEKMTLDEAVNKLKGPKGTQVHVTVVRVGLDRPLELTVTRAEIPQTTVRYAYMLEPGTGYILISDFGRGTGDEVATAIEKLRGQGMKRLLLDLRNNGGGLLDAAIDVADQFLPKGSKIVETRGRTRDSFQQYAAAGNHPVLGMPLVVLVNNGTASASEIVSGAIQDHDFGLIVGTPTWGKGLVQSVYNLPYGAGLALTTAKYYTPSGRLIQRDYSSYLDYLYNHAESADNPHDGGATAPATPQKPGTEYATDLGRKVYGGGGITPDVKVEPNEVPVFAQYLFAHNAFFNFAVERDGRQPPTRDWKPDAGLLDQFKAWLLAQKISTAEELDKAFADDATRAFTQRQIQAEMFNATFGLEAGHQVQAGGDVQIQAALKAFPRAAELLAARQSLGQAKTQRAALP
ncbi:MAG: S41 family peptidase [Acidobacteriota bacterium]